MLVAVSGSQGTGKSTVLSELEGLGYKIITRKTSRSILQDWGITLEQVNNDYELTLEFQDEIIRRKRDDEREAVESSEVWFTERTYADLFTYTLITLGKENRYSDWLDDYYIRCLNEQQHYDCVFYLKAGLFDVVHDGVRGSSKHYSRLVDIAMHDVTWHMTDSTKLCLVTTPNMEDRIQTILTHVEKIKQRKGI